MPILRSLKEVITQDNARLSIEFFLIFMLGARASLSNRENQKMEEIEVELVSHYRSTLSLQDLRDLFRSLSIYMVFDDQEIGGRVTPDLLRRASSIAVQRYQWSHGPRTFDQKLYYTFQCGGYPFFVLDTRTQRFKDDRPGLLDNHLLGRPSLDPVNHPGQLQRLKDWLSEQQKDRKNVPKFIVTSSVFAPNAMDERIAPDTDSWFGFLQPPEGPMTPAEKVFKLNAKRRDDSDSWPAYPVTRLELLQHIGKTKSRTLFSFPAISIAPTSPKSTLREPTALA